MMKPVLSLKHMSCQAIVIRFLWNPALVTLLHGKGRSYCKRFKNVELEHWISQLGLPKTLETHLYKIGISLISEPCQIVRMIRHLDCHFHLLDSSLVSLDPTGGIKCEETIVNILQQAQLDNSAKSILAKHFRVFDPLVADNLDSYVDRLRGTNGLNLREMHPHLEFRPNEMLRRIENMNIWELKHTWKILSQHDKKQLSGHLHIVMGVNYISDNPIYGFLVHNVFTEKINNFWILYDSTDHVDKFCFYNQFRRFINYLASPFCCLDQNSTNLVNKDLLALPDATAFYVLCTIIIRIVFRYDNDLYRYLLEIWDNRSDSFRKNFCRENELFLEILLHHRADHNPDYAGVILLLLQPFNPKLKANISHAFIGHYLMNCCLWNGPFRPPDNYLKKFIGSEDEISRLKKKAICMDGVRLSIFKNMKIPENSVISRDIVEWALVKKEESDEYINDLQRDQFNI